MSIVKVLCRSCGEPLVMDLAKITCPACCGKLLPGENVAKNEIAIGLRWFDRENLDVIKCTLYEALREIQGFRKKEANDYYWLKKLHTAAVALLELDIDPSGTASVLIPSFGDVVAEVGALLESRGYNV